MDRKKATQFYTQHFHFAQVSKVVEKLASDAKSLLHVVCCLCRLYCAH